jgi:hypothetical protein
MGQRARLAKPPFLTEIGDVFILRSGLKIELFPLVGGLRVVEIRGFLFRGTEVKVGGSHNYISLLIN